MKLSLTVYPTSVDQQRILLNEVLSSDSFTLRHIKDFSEFPPPTLIDGLVLPSFPRDFSSVNNAILKFRSLPDYELVPLIIVGADLTFREKEEIYGAGADIIYAQPFDQQELRLRLMAIRRQTRIFYERLNRVTLDPTPKSNHTTSEIQLSLEHAFNGVREGVIVFDTLKNPLFANKAAKLMLGVGDDLKKLLAASQQFAPIVDDHISQQPSSLRKSGAANLVSYYESTVRRSEGSVFRSTMRIANIVGENNLIGFSLAMSDLSEIYQLGGMLLQSERTRALSLLSLASCKRSLKTGLLGTPLKPLSKLYDLLDDEQPTCSLAREMTALLEVIDMVISPNVTLAVKDYGDITVLVKPGDLFQMLGHLILHAVEQAGPGGEVAVTTEPSFENGTLIVMVAASSARITPLLPNDYLTSLLRGDYSVVLERSATPEAKLDSKINFGLGMAETIAERYDSVIETKVASESVAKTRIILPIQKKKLEQW